MTKRTGRPKTGRPRRPITFYQEGDCLRCTSHRPNSSGRTQVSRNGGLFLLYHLMWEERNGPIPDGQILMHQCDNVWCHNLNHLRLGTQYDNIQDMRVKGRERHPGMQGSQHWNWQGGISDNYKRKQRTLNGGDE